MAEAEAQEKQETPKKKKGGLIKMLLLAVIMGGLGAGGFFAGQMFGGKGEPAPEGHDVAGEVAKDAASEGGHGEGGHGEAAKEGGHGGAEEGGHGEAGAAVEEEVDLFFQFHPFTTNLADPKGRDYLVATVYLKAANAKMLEVLERNRVPLRSATLQLMAAKTRDEVSTTAGQNRLTRELKARYNQIVPSGAIENIYFTDFRIHRQ